MTFRIIELEGERSSNISCVLQEREGSWVPGSLNDLPRALRCVHEKAGAKIQPAKLPGSVFFLLNTFFHDYSDYIFYFHGQC